MAMSSAGCDATHAVRKRITGAWHPPANVACSPHVAALVAAAELEKDLPWTSVKKTWTTRRQGWFNSVQNALGCDQLSKQVLVLEGALRMESVSPSWSQDREGWRSRVMAALSPELLDDAIAELDSAILWERIQHQTQPLTRGTPIPGSLDDAAFAAAEGLAPNMPEGVPRVAIRILLLLRAMGVRSHMPGVALQLLEVMHGYTTDVLTESLSNSRLRTLGSASREQQPEAEVSIEPADVLLAVRGQPRGEGARSRGATAFCRYRFCPP